MAHPAGESNDGVLRLDFDRRLMLQFRGSIVTFEAIPGGNRVLIDMLPEAIITRTISLGAREGYSGNGL
jgi:hypothetical protein